MSSSPNSSDLITYLDVRQLAVSISNWGRWGPDDQLGTLNIISPDMVKHASTLVRSGLVVSLAIPLDADGPQTGRGSRFNPIHLMVRDGGDVISRGVLADEGPVRAVVHQSADDIVIMPLQAGTQWDALAHVFDAGQMYNGYSAAWVGSSGALRNDVRQASDRLVGRGVLLDIPSWKQLSCLPQRYAITVADLEACAAYQGVTVGPGDVLLIRTGLIARVRSEGTWEGYADPGRGSPGLALETARWLHARDVAAVAADNIAVEVLPSEVVDVPLPLHLICLVHMGLMFGEIFDLETLADACRADGLYEFLFVGPALPFAGAVGSPVNPIAIK